MTRKQRKVLFRIVLAAVCVVLLNLIHTDGWIRLLSFFAVYLIIGYDILRKAALGIFNGRIFDENFLMAIATVGAFALAIYDRSGDYNEAIAVMLFYQIGEFFQSYALGKSRKSIGKLMDIRPDYANLEVDGRIERCSPDAVAIGSTILVQPGERIPLDGTVTDGVSSLNTVALTGESLPREVQPGDEVISGCINLDGVLSVRTTKSFGESTVSKILELVENASSRKSRTEKFISRFSRVYTPAVCAAALALALLPPLILLLTGHDPNPQIWIYRALTFLVISCPCALVISIPLSFFAGIGAASRAGILIKGSNYLEALARVRYAVFDKTGTLTEGGFEVVEIIDCKIAPKKILEYAVYAECASSHPISKSLQKAFDGEIDRARVLDIKEISGGGVLATVDGKAVAVGNQTLMNAQRIPCTFPDRSGTLVYVAVEHEHVGTILIADRIKRDAAQSIRALRALGIQKTVMLTGDTREIADAVSKELGIDEAYAQLLPADKVRAVETLMEEKEALDRLAFIGDGMNDAPVLARADIGIAMGGMGSDAAIEAADVVLMDDIPLQIPKAIRISRKCLSIVRQNIVFSLLVKFLCLMLVALGFANMWIGIFADVGVMMLAVFNALRAMRISN